MIYYIFCANYISYVTDILAVFGVDNGTMKQYLATSLFNKATIKSNPFFVGAIFWINCVQRKKNSPDK